MRAGVPQVVVPVFADHPFWAAHLYRKGVAARPVPFPRFTREALVASVRRAVTDPGMTLRAQALGRAVAKERGVDNACDVIEAWATASGVPVTTGG